MPRRLYLTNRLCKGGDAPSKPPGVEKPAAAPASGGTGAPSAGAGGGGGRSRARRVSLPASPKMEYWSASDGPPPVSGGWIANEGGGGGYHRPIGSGHKAAAAPEAAKEPRKKAAEGEEPKAKDPAADPTKQFTQQHVEGGGSNKNKDKADTEVDQPAYNLATSEYTLEEPSTGEGAKLDTKASDTLVDQPAAKPSKASDTLVDQPATDPDAKAVAERSKAAAYRADAQDKAHQLEEYLSSNPQLSPVEVKNVRDSIEHYNNFSQHTTPSAKDFKIKRDLDAGMSRHLKEHKTSKKAAEAKNKSAKAEAARASVKAQRAKAQADKAKAQADKAKATAEKAKGVEAERAKVKAERAKAQADKASARAEKAKGVQEQRAKAAAEKAQAKEEGTKAREARVKAQEENAASIQAARDKAKEERAKAEAIRDKVRKQREDKVKRRLFFSKLYTTWVRGTGQGATLGAAAADPYGGAGRLVNVVDYGVKGTIGVGQMLLGGNPGVSAKTQQQQLADEDAIKIAKDAEDATGNNAQDSATKKPDEPSTAAQSSSAKKPSATGTRGQYVSPFAKTEPDLRIMKPNKVTKSLTRLFVKL